MSKPAVFFDRDNTLIASDGYLGDPTGVVLVDGAADAVARARALGYATVVFSNQSGVARGMFGEEAVHAVNNRLDELLQDHNHDAIIDRHEFCPYHPDATVERYRVDSDLRKPNAGMIRQAAEALGLEVSKSWVIGDAPRDIEAGKAAGCRTILVRNPGLPKSPAAEAATTVEPDHTVDTVSEAVELIERALAEQARQAAAEATAAAAAAAAAAVPTPSTPAIAPAMDAPAPPAARATTASPIRDPQRAAAPTKAFSEPEVAGSTRRLEELAEQILAELRRRADHHEPEFSVSKLMAGIVQVIALAALFIGYMRWDDTGSRDSILLVAVVLQALTIALLIMSRQR